MTEAEGYNLKSFLAQAFYLLELGDMQNFDKWISKTASLLKEQGASLDDFCGLFIALLTMSNLLKVDANEDMTAGTELLCFHQTGEITRIPLDENWSALEDFLPDPQVTFIVLLFMKEFSINPYMYPPTSILCDIFLFSP